MNEELCGSQKTKNTSLILNIRLTSIWTNFHRLLSSRGRVAITDCPLPFFHKQTEMETRDRIKILGILSTVEAKMEQAINLLPSFHNIVILRFSC